MFNSQFQEERNSKENIEKRLYMEIHDFHHAGGPENWDNLVELLIDARSYILYVQKKYSLDKNEIVPIEE